MPHCKSRVNYRGALQGDGARSVWTGDVVIRATGVGTDTVHEVNHNLLLTDGARADSVPNLESSRARSSVPGMPARPAGSTTSSCSTCRHEESPTVGDRRLIVRGFFADVIERIQVPELVERLLATVDRELEGSMGCFAAIFRPVVNQSCSITSTRSLHW